MNKVLVLVYVPLLEQEYNMYIPISKKIGTIRKIIIDAISEISGGYLVDKDNLKLYDRKSGICYDTNMVVKESTIRNGTKMLLL